MPVDAQAWSLSTSILIFLLSQDSPQNSRRILNPQGKEHLTQGIYENHKSPQRAQKTCIIATDWGFAEFMVKNVVFPIIKEA